MPHAKPADLPNAGGGRWPASKDHFRSVQWGDLEVGYTTTEHPLDTTELNRIGGLAGGVCPALSALRLRVRRIHHRGLPQYRPRKNEVISAGEVTSSRPATCRIQRSH